MTTIQSIDEDIAVLRTIRGKSVYLSTCTGGKGKKDLNKEVNAIDHAILLLEKEKESLK